MDSLYLKIEISKALQDEKEVISYYIVKDHSYGIKVCKVSNQNITNSEEITIRDIFNSEEDAKKFIDSLTDNGTDFSQIEYVIEDFVKNANSII